MSFLRQIRNCRSRKNSLQLLQQNQYEVFFNNNIHKTMVGFYTVCCNKTTANSMFIAAKSTSEKNQQGNPENFFHKKFQEAATYSTREYDKRSNC